MGIAVNFAPKGCSVGLDPTTADPGGLRRQFDCSGDVTIARPRQAIWLRRRDNGKAPRP